MVTGEDTDATRNAGLRQRWRWRDIALRLSAPVFCGLIFGHLIGGTGSTANASSLPFETVHDIPNTYLALYQRAATTCKGLRWQLLAAVGRVESDHGRATAAGVTGGENPSGAAGPMQFLAATWKQYGTADIRDRYDPARAIPAAARFLCMLGAGTNEYHAASSYYAGPYASSKGRAQGDAYATIVESQATAYAGGQRGPGGTSASSSPPLGTPAPSPNSRLHRHHHSPTT